jgi:hypothetical protein
MNRISIAMCTYNGEKYLHEQLVSIAQQTRLPDELVICDDGSSDSTPELVARFTQSVSFPVRWIRNEKNLGSTKNFEQAISLCTGDLIALCDQDDIWLPEKLACQAEMLEGDRDLGGVFSDAQLITGKSQRRNTRLWASFLFTRSKQKKFRAGQAASILLSGNVVTGATLMIRASLRSSCLPIPPLWVHDGWIAWMIVLYSKLGAIDTPLIQYRIHDSQQIGIDGASYARLPLKQRFEAAAREEAAKHLAFAEALGELQQRACEIGKLSEISAIEGKILFLKQRGSSYNNRLHHLFHILCNVRHYQKYERSLKDLLRDAAIVVLT